MRIGAVLSPIADWGTVLVAAHAADESGLDAVGLWDHYHSRQPEWGYVAGWSALGAIAAVTRRVRVVPMVLNGLHYELGVLAKESSTLAILSGGRFELGIGAGDWPASFAAWGRPYPPAGERLESLGASVEALRLLWRGGPVEFEQAGIRLDGAICTPVPDPAPRVVVGVGGSRRGLERAIAFADEVNVYGDPAIVAGAVHAAAAAATPRSVSVHIDWSWASWPDDPAAAIEPLRAAGVDRLFVSVGGPEVMRRIDALARLSAA